MNSAQLMQFANCTPVKLVLPGIIPWTVHKITAAVFAAVDRPKSDVPVTPKGIAPADALDKFQAAIKAS